MMMMMMMMIMMMMDDDDDDDDDDDERRRRRRRRGRYMRKKEKAGGWYIIANETGHCCKSEKSLELFWVKKLKGMHQAANWNYSKEMSRMIRLFQSVLGLAKRSLCCSRKRDNIGELPFTVVVRQTAPEDPYPSGSVSTGWDSRWSEKQAVQERIDEWRRKKMEANHSSIRDIDFFDDMQPNIEKAKKVVLKSTMSQGSSDGSRNLFGFSDDTRVDVPLSAQLGDLDDEEMPAWDDDIDSTLRAHRAEKHRSRIEEHDRRMREKRNERAVTGYL
ncbi:unnamed protein product [Angiostrongylus costaricensis]|uniref:Phosducin domain-containing protein n=1 Tax=Angiostrongylus costaricensis TaxID=334426 RepID=A0A158PI24_ANGCS|nr:unnamed protein product [Angiostrongylus costaricensis]